MGKIFSWIITLAVISISAGSKAQPIPVELMAGSRFLSVDVTVSKKFSENSKWGFFHMNTLQVDNKTKLKNSFILQDLITYEFIRNLKIAGGAFYGMPGFNPTAGFQYNYSGKKFLFLFAPRVNIIAEPSYDFMTILTWKVPLSEKVRLFTRLKLLNIFDANSHIKSYQWFRLGLDKKGYQYGLAADFDEPGAHPKVQYNFGFFIRKEIL